MRNRVALMAQAAEEGLDEGFVARFRVAIGRKSGGQLGHVARREPTMPAKLLIKDRC